MGDPKTLHKVAISGQETNIRDSADRVHFVDFITEIRQHNGVAYISLGSGILDGADSPFCDITCRLRMSMTTVAGLHSALGQLLAQTQRAPENSKAPRTSEDSAQHGPRSNKLN